MRRILTYIILLFSVLAWSQTGTSVATGLPYECSFEESEDLSAWVFNPYTPNAADQWMVGSVVHSEGKRSLYPSGDGMNPRYNKHPNIIAAYLRYKFPDAVGTETQHFNLSFDWKGMGNTTNARLFVMVCPETYAFTYPTGNPFYLANNVSETNGRLTNATQAACETFGGTTLNYLCGSETWQNVTLTNDILVNSDDSHNPFIIIFMWVNDNVVDSLTVSSISIDNVQINSAALQKPQNLDVIPQCEDSTMLVTWDQPGAANEFEIQYREVGKTSWRRASGLQDGAPGFTRTIDMDGTAHCSYVLTRILEGSYDVRVHASYDGALMTGWVYKNLILVYCPDNHCINYIDLDNPSVVCTTGYNPEANKGHTPYDVIVPPVDFGPDAEESRHTLHVDPTEVDPRTDSLLKTVPDGSLASVRLGNWKSGGEAESITYDITVDSTNQGILIVKYAIVFENPPGHDTPGSQPRFNLEILDPNGDLIDPTCGRAEFTYESGVAAGWNTTKDNKAAWKDWTVVGVDLMQYHGQTIKVRFTTMDCGWSGHYAYAYFTVDCANAHIETDNCGTDARINCKAPDGFSYSWYIGDPDNGGIYYDNKQEIEVAADRQVYTCRLSFIEQPNCYFDISTVSAPRFPVPEYSYERVNDRDCTNKLKFTNTSHVMNMFDGYEVHTSEPCTDFHWEFRNLDNGDVKVTDAKNPSYLCAQSGGRVEVTYTAYIGAENTCDSTRKDTLLIPSILSEPTEFHYISCSENPVKFDGKWFNKDTIYTGLFTNESGCDSVSTLYLRVYPKPEDKYIHDSICSDDYVLIDGKKYNQSCENYLIMLKTKDGCDSALYLTLTVNERIKADVQQLPFACADDEVFYINFDIQAGQYDSLHIAFSTPQLRDTTIYDPMVNSVGIPYPASITPGHYMATITFYQFCCGKHVEQRAIDVRYMSSIVEQKWNDVLTLLSPKYNGGYEFLDYQWYKNNEPLMGENHSYLYQPLDTTAEYYVVVTRSDSVQIATCPIQPVYHPQQSKYPSVVKAGQKMRMYMAQETTIWYYTVSGQLYSSFTMPQGHGMMDVPNTPGVYVLRAVDKQGETQAQVLLVE